MSQSLKWAALIILGEVEVEGAVDDDDVDPSDITLVPVLFS